MFTSPPSHGDGLEVGVQVPKNFFEYEFHEISRYAKKQECLLLPPHGAGWSEGEIPKDGFFLLELNDIFLEIDPPIPHQWGWRFQNITSVQNCTFN